MRIDKKQVTGLQAELDGKKEFNGFPYDDPLTYVDLTMNATPDPDELEVSPVGASFDFWVAGVKYTKSGTDAVQISTDQALHYVYYDNTGTLQVSTSIWDILADIALVATVYKDGSVYEITNEMHYYDRDRAWHRWAHDTIGARYESGLTGTFTNTTLSVTQGISADEDLERDTGGTKTNCALWYRNSILSAMRVEAGITTPYKLVTTVIQYDAAGTLTNVDNNKFVNSYVYATGDINYPIAVLVGQEQHANITGARNEAFPSILLSTAEWKLLYRVTYKNVGGTPTYQEATDFRLVSSGPAIDGGSTDHAGLTGRDALNQHPASAIAPDTTNFDNNLSAADDTVQKALETLDELSVGGSESSFILAASDESSDLTTGISKITFRTPYGLVLSDVRASVKTAPTGSGITVDINEGGVSILSTKLTIDAGEKTSTTAAVPVVISDANIADDAEITIDIDVIGSTIAGAGLKVTLIFAPVPDEEAILLAASDETSDLTTGTGKLTFRMPYAFTLSDVRASVTGAPTGSVLTVDINEGGVTILSTKITIDATEKTSETAAIPPVISDTSLADDAEITIDIDTVGSTIPGRGLKVALIGTKT